MSKRVLIVGRKQGLARWLEKAQAIGFKAVTTESTMPAELAQSAQTFRARGICAASEYATEAVAQAAAELALPGLGTAAASAASNKLVMRQMFDAAGLPTPPFSGARTLEEAEAAAKVMGVPLIVKPVDGTAGRGVMRVDYIEDLSLAFVQAQHASCAKTVLLEHYIEGELFSVDGLVRQGTFKPGGISGREPCSPPYCYDLGIFMPSGVSPSVEQTILSAVNDALAAMHCDTGSVHAEVVVTADGPRVVEITGRQDGPCVSADLVSLAYGIDLMADTLRIAVGDEPQERRRCLRGAALFWIPSPSGIVTEMQGLDAARAVSGVEDVVVHAATGDVVRHIIDGVTRDRAGYIVASGTSSEAAVESARRARDLIKIVTCPNL